MPRKAKDEEKIIKEKENKKAVTKKAVKKESTKEPASKASKAVKKTTTKKATKEPTSKASKAVKKTTAKKATKEPTSKASKTVKKTTTKKATKETASKASKAVKKTTTKKATKETASKASKAVKKVNSNESDKKNIEVVEYYDLPYRYNKTIVKVLAQTPNKLFVYWDISDEDKQRYINEYGEFFFNDTKPVLIVHNITMNYSFEVDINDFANSWYLHINDANCDYKIELGRRPINKYAKINDYLYISSSNEMDAPNDHILFDTLNNIVYFKNVKNNMIIKKNISLSFLTKIGKLYNIKEFYKKLYKDENIDFEKLNLKNMPSS